jgi:hypothetical protein
LLLPHEDFKNTDIFFAFQHLAADLPVLDASRASSTLDGSNKLPTWSAQLMLLPLFPPAVALATDYGESRRKS